MVLYYLAENAVFVFYTHKNSHLMFGVKLVLIPNIKYAKRGTGERHFPHRIMQTKKDSFNWLSFWIYHSVNYFRLFVFVIITFCSLSSRSTLAPGHPEIKRMEE